MMKKFFAIAFLAIFAFLPTFASAASPGVLSETVSDGFTTMTRSLAPSGVLSESACMVSYGANLQSSRCLTQKTKLSKVEQRKLAAQMTASQDSVAMRANYALQAEGPKKGMLGIHSIASTNQSGSQWSMALTSAEASLTERSAPRSMRSDSANK